MRFCDWCEDQISPRVLAINPKACYCTTTCQREGTKFGIYGDSRAEQINGARYERELAEAAAAPKKPKTILRRAGAV